MRNRKAERKNRFNKILFTPLKNKNNLNFLSRHHLFATSPSKTKLLRVLFA